MSRPFRFVTDARVQSWSLSLVLHAMAVALASSLLATLTPAPVKEPFRWDVSVVEEPSTDAAQSAPPKETAPPMAPPAPPVAQPKTAVTRKVDPTPVTQRPSTLVRTPQDVKPAVERTPPESVESPSPAATTEPLARHAEPAHDLVQERQPVESEVAPAISEAISRTTPVEPPPAPIPAASPAPPVTAEAAPITKDPTPVEPPQPVIAQTAPIETPAATSSPVQERAAEPIKEHPPAIAESAPSQKPAPDQIVPHQSAATLAPVRTALAPKPDYGWLTRALWRRIEQLKLYPQLARLNRWEGTVVVRVVVREDGYIADLVMEKSSGHDDLDQDALELLRKASPLALKHELGRSELTVRIPISYKLQ